MYVENKDGGIDGVSGRIGWVTFSKSGRSVYYRNRRLQRSGGQGIAGNCFDTETGEEYWVSGIKVGGGNTHWAEPKEVRVDADAKEEYERLKSR